MKMLRIAIIAVTVLFVLNLFRMQIIALNAVKEEGQTILLDLRPADPRALMLGDYMTLRYVEERVPNDMTLDDLPPKGAFVMQLDDNNVASYVALFTGQDMQSDEVKLNYTRTNRSLTFGAPRFYFENGTAEDYEPARYGVFKVDEEGRAILVNLAKDDFEIIQPKPQ